MAGLESSDEAFAAEARLSDYLLGRLPASYSLEEGQSVSVKTLLSPGSLRCAGSKLQDDSVICSLTESTLYSDSPGPAEAFFR